MKRACSALSFAMPIVAVGAELRQKYASGWRPTGDDAIFAIHAHDVFTAKFPLLGTYSVVTQSAGQPVPPVYHLGPLVSWVLSIPERVFSERLGIAIGAGFVNLAMMLAVVVIVRRIASVRVSALVSGAMALTAWSVGRNTLAEPWNPYIGLWTLPLLVALGVAWAIRADTRSTLPAMVFVASFAVQAHYLLLGPVVAVVAASMLARGAPPTRRSAVLGASIALACWLPAIVQQIVGSQGNLSAWLTATRASTQNTAPFFSYSLRFVVNTVGIVPVTFRGPLNAGQLIGLGAAPSLLAWLVNAVVLGLLVVGAASVWRTRRIVSVFAMIALALLAGTAFTLSRYPVPLVSFPYYRIVMCWIASSVAWGAAIACAVSMLSKRASPRWKAFVVRVSLRQSDRFVLFPMLVVVALIITVAHSADEPVDELGARATQRLASETLRNLPRKGDYVVRGDGVRGVFAVYGVFREMLLDGRRVYVSNDEVQLRDHYGVGERAAMEIVVASGSLAAPKGARVLATYDGRTDSERQRFAALPSNDASGERFELEQAQFVVYLVAT